MNATVERLMQLIQASIDAHERYGANWCAQTVHVENGAPRMNENADRRAYVDADTALRAELESLFSGRAVELPERKPVVYMPYGYPAGQVDGFNACLDELAKLQPLYRAPPSPHEDSVMLEWMIARMGVVQCNGETFECWLTPVGGGRRPGPLADTPRSAIRAAMKGEGS